MLFKITQEAGNSKLEEVVSPKRAEEILRQFANLIERGATLPTETLVVQEYDAEGAISPLHEGREDASWGVK